MLPFQVKDAMLKGRTELAGRYHKARKSAQTIRQETERHLHEQTTVELGLPVLFLLWCNYSWSLNRSPQKEVPIYLTFILFSLLSLSAAGHQTNE